MNLILNGAPRTVPEFASLADLAAWLQLPAFGSAVELNGTVIPRSRHGETPLHDGDRLEIVRLVGGG